MNDTFFSAAAVYADQDALQALESKDSLTHEESIERSEIRDRVWAGQDHYGGIIFRIPEQRIETLNNRVAKIEKRALKLNTAAPTVTDTTEREDQRISKSKIHTWAYVAVNGIAPKIDGWTFIATLQHEQEGNIIRRVPNPSLTGAARDFEKADGLAAYRTVTSKCDHCQKIRQRKDTYVVVHEDGRTMQVGTNCLADFLGGASPQQVAKGLEYIYSILDETRGYQSEGFSGISVDPSYDTEWFMTHVAWAVRRFGWVSRSRAYDYGKTASADRASINAHNQERQIRESGVPAWEDPTDEDVELAKATIAWVRNEFEGDSDYASNLVTALASERISYRSEGIAASGIFCYQRETDKLKKEETGLNEFFGTKKDRLDLRLKVISSRFFENGGYYITSLKDAEGRTFSWFGSYGLNEDATYTGKWTIKDHREYKGTKQTCINRPAKLEEIE